MNIIIQLLLALAISMLGTPYEYAHATPQAVDCSGFTYFCYQKVANETLPRTAYELGYSDLYPDVEIDKLLPGDVVCFNTNLKDKDLSDHVGIYMGDGYFIHSSSSDEKVVIDNLYEGYYNERFSWGKRIIED